MNMERPVIALTQGDTNGIGLEVVLKSLSNPEILELIVPVVFANHQLVRQTLKMISAEELPLNFITSTDDLDEDMINIIHVGSVPIVPQYGSGSPASGAAAVESLVAACNFIDDGGADILVTAPINKGAAQVDGFEFPGHTEFLEERFGEGGKAQMILCNDDIRVALCTTHLPVSKISSHITQSKVLEGIEDLNKALIESFAIERPKIAVLSLNPHCGDDGLLGDEEKNEIIPAVNAARDKGIMAFGPVAADGFFGVEGWRQVDGILAMYHDQGLTPFKALARATGVNYTAGLPIVRTSPDHGTAYDIAGRGEADAESMREAIYKGIDIYRNRMRYEEMSANPLRITTQPRGDRKKDKEE